MNGLYKNYSNVMNRDVIIVELGECWVVIVVGVGIEHNAPTFNECLDYFENNL